jgi:hypothetical protein
MSPMDRLAGFNSPGRTLTVVLPPDSLEPMGLHGKNAFAEQVNLIGQDANVISDVGPTAGKPQKVHIVYWQFVLSLSEHNFTGVVVAWASTDTAF